MNKPNTTLRWLRYIGIFLLAGAFTGLAHEFGHFLAAEAMGYHPVISFNDGGRVDVFDAHGIPLESWTPRKSLVFGAGGPAVTLFAALLFTLLWMKHPRSFALFAFAIVNACMRFNMIVDGSNSDEGNMTEVLLGFSGRMTTLFVPLGVWTASIILTCILIKRQTFMKPTYWFIPVFAVLSGIAIRISFALLNLLRF